MKCCWGIKLKCKHSSDLFEENRGLYPNPKTKIIEDLLIVDNTTNHPFENILRWKDGKISCIFFTQKTHVNYSD